jgi:predicted RNase H-like HicB family nuclease
MPIRNYQVVIEQDEDGFYVAEVPGVKACYTQGKTFEEVMANIREVLEMCLEEMKSRGEEIPEQSEIIGIKRIEVSV